MFVRVSSGAPNCVPFSVTWKSQNRGSKWPDLNSTLVIYHMSLCRSHMETYFEQKIVLHTRHLYLLILFWFSFRTLNVKQFYPWLVQPLDLAPLWISWNWGLLQCPPSPRLEEVTFSRCLLFFSPQKPISNSIYPRIDILDVLNVLSSRCGPRNILPTDVSVSVYTVVCESDYITV
jgi:hypothetical protein